MFVMHLALGGCLKAPPVAYGLTEDTGGHITYILGAADAMADMPGVSRVEVVTRLFDDPALPGPYADPRETVRPGFDIVRLPTSSPGYLSKEALARETGDFAEALAAYIDGLSEHPRIIHAHFADAGCIAARMRDRFGIPFVFTAHSLGIDKRDTLDRPSEGLNRRIAMEGRIIGTADAVVASSADEIGRQIVRYPSVRTDRLHRIAPGVAVPDATGARATACDLVRPFLRDMEKPAILAIARPVHKKNLLGLVEMYGRSLALQERANLVILAGLRDTVECGEVEQREVIGGLLEAIDAHDLYGKVAYPKRHTQTDIAALYAWTAARRGVFANPAHTEPFGLTLLEAASFGLPVVATCHGGPVDIVGDIGHGMLADPADGEVFGRALLSCLSCSETWDRAARNARAGIERYTWQRYAERCTALYRELATRSAPRTAGRLSRTVPRTFFASDIDNTLTGDAGAARDFDRAIGRMDDVAFAIATGRHLDKALAVLGAWDITPPGILITAVGTEIYWRQADGSLALDEDFGASMAGSWRPEDIAVTLAGIGGLTAQPSTCQGPFKRSYFVRSAGVAGAVRRALKGAGLRAHVIHSHGDLLDVVPEGAGKGAAVAWCARTLDIAQERTISAGDSGNDADMLTRTGGAILVGNADADIRAAVPRGSAHLSRHAHAAGVLDGLARFGFGGQEARA